MNIFDLYTKLEFYIEKCERTLDKGARVYLEEYVQELKYGIWIKERENALREVFNE